MAESEKVSIVVAIYKSEKFLDRLIVSLMEQTYKDIEIILVDDGSPDSSGKICDLYAEKDPRIKVVHKENGGCCEARNVGMEQCTGKWLVIADGDDWLETDCVEYMLRLVHETNSDMGMSTEIFTTRDRAQTKNDVIETWSAEKSTAALFYPYIAVGPWNKIYKLEMLQKNNITFSVPWSGEGLYFSTTASQYANHLGVGHRKIYNYRLNNINSGLTHYNVQMGINACANIKYMNEHLIIRTPVVINAINWHIWKNYTYLLYLIVATHSEKDNSVLLKDCIKNIRRRLFPVLLHSDIKIKNKVANFRTGLFPILSSKIHLKKEQKELVKDILELDK